MLNPNDPTTHHWYAMFPLVQMERFEEALEELRRARTLDPLALIYAADVAAVLYFRREPDRAIEQCRRVLALDPSFARAHMYAGWVHSQRDELEQAVVALAQAKRLDDSAWTAGWLGYAYARAGRRADAERVLCELGELSDRGGEVAFLAALVHAGLGENDPAVESLAQACMERSMGFALASFTPAFDHLRDDPRFQRLFGQSRNGPRAGNSLRAARGFA